MVTLPGGIRIAVEMAQHGKIVVNIYHVTTTDPIVTIKLLQIAQLFADWWTADLSVWLSNDLVLNSVTALDISIENGEKQTLPVVPGIPGDLVGMALPNNVASVVSLRTAKTGRSFMGRSFLAGLSEDFVSVNSITPGLAASFVDAFDELITGLETIDTLLVVASFISGGVPRVTGVATEVDSITMNLRVDTQRRRLPD